ncbi:lipopolysaccharide biosynthesis protein [Shewanella mangrovisoli]|uniref:Lipopolysaccharide biosynthesis protein n=1 Tax=Shewanella mangrovisoli TaxID=2864211 RepID=A0ABV4VG12_9GAMM
MIRSIVKDSFLYLVSKSLVALINISLIYYILKVYGAVEYSKYTIAFILSLCISNFTSTWFSQSYLREKKTVTDSFILFSLFVVFLLIIVFSSIIIFFEEEYSIGVLSFVLLTLSQSIYLIGRTFLQKKREIKKYFYYDLIRMIIILFFCYILSLISQSFLYIIFSYMIGNFVFLLVFLKYVKIKKISFSTQNLNQIYSWFKFGFPVSLWLTIASSQMLIDRYLMSLIFDQETTGFYSSYYDFVLKVCALFVIPISNAIYPILVENEGEIKSYKSLALNLSIACLCVALLISILTYISLSSNLFRTYISIEFDPFFMSVMVFGISLWQFALIFQKPLEMEMKTKLMVLNIICCLVLSTAINILCVNYFGLNVFVYSLAISALLYLFLTYIFVKK